MLGATPGEDVQHDEVRLLGQDDLREGVAGEERCKRWRHAPPCASSAPRDLPTPRGSEGRGSRAPADRTASKASQPAERDGVRVLHRSKIGTATLVAVQA